MAYFEPISRKEASEELQLTLFMPRYLRVGMLYAWRRHLRETL